MTVTQPVESGEWLEVKTDKRFVVECCDCGLVHNVYFRVEIPTRHGFKRGRTVLLRATRNGRLTAKARITNG